MWRRGTIVDWASSRPGKGRRSSAPAAALPPVSVDGDPDELLGTAEVASLLGYGSVASFSSALYQGRIPELPEPETLEREEGSRGGARKKWRRATVVAAARKRADGPPLFVGGGRGIVRFAAGLAPVCRCAACDGLVPVRAAGRPAATARISRASAR
ncbi:hypothetical protein [Streptomyces mirabilis]|uniref:hypothetical protein n=1 Tax=Streptomyces mirabilis TaxID=68239 RepID=UPI00369D94DD